MTAQTSEGPDVHEMLVVHGMFRRALGEMPARVRGVPDGDRVKADVVVDHIELGVSALHHHHTAEDHHLWPVLLARATPQRELVERMESQHEGLAARLERVQTHAADFRYDPSTANGERLATTLEGLEEVLEEHLQDEEAHILPLAAEHMSAAEWNTLGQEALRSLTTTQKELMMGMLLEYSSPEDAQRLLHHAPILVTKVGWPLVMHRQYEAYKRRLDEASSGA
jgi:hemerythrin-like domain-containing protein